MREGERMRLVVGVDETTLKYVQYRLGEFSKRAPNAISNALNRGITNVGSNIRKEVRKEYHIKAGDVNATLSRHRANRGSLAATVKSKGHLIGLDKFKVNPKTVNPNRKTHLNVSVKKGGGGKIKGAFNVDIHGVKVFERLGRFSKPPSKGRYAGTKAKREDIGRLFGPSIPQMLGREDISEFVMNEGQNTFEKRLEHEINRILEVGRRGR